MQISEALQAAEQYVALGFRPVQLHSLRAGQNVCTCQRGDKCRTAGKHPVNDDWEKTETFEPSDWMRKVWATNVGLVTGHGFWVLDIDPDKGGLDSAKKLAAEHGAFEPTRIVKTGSGGYHYYFAMPEGVEIRNSVNKIAPGIDVRGGGGQVVAPPSQTDKGVYTLVSGADLTPAPQWLLDIVTAKPSSPTVTSPVAPAEPVDDAERARLNGYAQKVIEAELGRLRRLPETGWNGEPWNQTVFHVACSLIEIANSSWNDYTVEQAYHHVFSTAPRDNDGFDDETVNDRWKSAIKRVDDKVRPKPANRPPDDFFDSPDVRVDPRLDPSSDGGDSTPAGSPSATPATPVRSWDDLGNAKRMVDRYVDRIRWVEQADSWAVYEGGRWQMSGPRLAQSLAQRLLDNLIPDEADRYSDTEIHNPGGRPELTMREAFCKWAKGQRMSARIAACLTEARAIPRIQATLADFDTDPMLFNAANGVVDLRTGLLSQHDPNLMLMQQSPVAYDPTAPATLWQAFLDRVMPNQADQQYLQRVVGYSITGKIGERALFLHHGVGANGKSVFLQVMTHIVGEYGQVVPRSTLLVSQNEQHPEAVARMVGKRFLQTSETAAGRRLDEEIVKGLTGGEMQTARFMHQGSFDFRPTGKIHYVTNHLPRLTDAESIWERIHLISWLVTIPKEERDLDLTDKLCAEAEGVLAWAVRGAQMWHESGLQVPSSARDGLKVYREDQDVFGEFLSERCRPALGSRTPSSTLYEAYQGWAFRSGIKPMSAQAFGATLKERGYSTYRNGTARGFDGIIVIPAISDAEMMMRGATDEA
jgi:putative DNA primase/helicase